MGNGYITENWTFGGCLAITLQRHAQHMGIVVLSSGGIWIQEWLFLTDVLEADVIFFLSTF